MLISGIVSFAISATKAIASLGLVVEGLKALGNVLTVIGKALGLIKPETQVDELGDKALQAEEAGITPDKFETYSAYVRAIDGFQVDPERSKKISLEEKVEKGIELTIGIAKERFPEISTETFTKFSNNIKKHPTVFTENSMQILAKEMESDSNCIENVVGYLDHTEKNQDRLEGAESILTEMIKVAVPGTDDSAARRQLYNI